MANFIPITWEEVQELRIEVYRLEIDMENLPHDHYEYKEIRDRLVEIEAKIEVNLNHFKDVQNN